MSTLRITEIFYSLQGETQTVGLPTVFIRLTGCPLRCGYCDTEYAFKGGEMLSIENILAQVAQYQPQYVTVTGGEPLAQKNCWALLSALCDQNYRVSLETSGAIATVGIDARVTKIVDFKTPGSGEVDKNVYSNIDYLNAQDEIKFVICDHADFEWSKNLVLQYALHQKAHVLFSPSHDQLHPRILAEWILSARLPVRLQIQLHKYLWGEERGR